MRVGFENVLDQRRNTRIENNEICGPESLSNTKNNEDQPYEMLFNCAEKKILPGKYSTVQRLTTSTQHQYWMNVILAVDEVNIFAGQKKGYRNGFN